MVADRYPFFPAATADAPLPDFVRLLGPGGAIDAFFNAQLRPYVDTTARPWRLRAVDGVNAPVSAADLAQFQRAEAIRDLFFPAGAAQPMVRFDLSPGTLDPRATDLKLELGPTTLTATRGTTARPAALAWPGRPPATTARLTVNVAGSPPATTEATGPWAVFRLLAQARPTTAGDRTTLLFTLGDLQARLELHATPNPFTSPLLPAFRCPVVQ